MKVRINCRGRRIFVRVNNDRAEFLVRLLDKLLLPGRIISEAKLDLIIRQTGMVKKDINNQILKGEYVNAKKEEKNQSSEEVLEVRALNPAEGEV